MEILDKRSRIQEAAAALFKQQGVEATSVNDIVKSANVAKGTFYVYYKDKNALVTQILTKQHGHLLNELLNRSYEVSQQQPCCWKLAFLNELIDHHRNNPLLLKTIQKNMPFIFDTEAHRTTVFQEVQRLPEFLATWRRVGESERNVINRFMLVMEIVSVVCFNALTYDHPDILENILPEVIRSVHAIMESEVIL